MGRLCECLYLVLSGAPVYFPGMGCNQHWWYCVSFSLLCISTLSLDGGVNVYCNCFSVGPLYHGGISASIFDVYVVFS